MSQHITYENRAERGSVACCLSVLPWAPRLRREWLRELRDRQHGRVLHCTLEAWAEDAFVPEAAAFGEQDQFAGIPWLQLLERQSAYCAL